MFFFVVVIHIKAQQNIIKNIEVYRNNIKIKVKKFH